MIAVCVCGEPLPYILPTRPTPAALADFLPEETIALIAYAQTLQLYEALCADPESPFYGRFRFRGE